LKTLRFEKAAVQLPQNIALPQSLNFPRDSATIPKKYELMVTQRYVPSDRENTFVSAFFTLTLSFFVLGDAVADLESLPINKDFIDPRNPLLSFFAALQRVTIN
jgi:hypothetical protein